MTLQVLTSQCHGDQPVTLAQYKDQGGYGAFSKALADGSPQKIVQTIDDANLRGRGGAAFPMGMKLKTMPEDGADQRYVICNADEMEPGTFKDRLLIYKAPHQLIEGMLLTAYGIGAKYGIIFIRPEYEAGALILELAVEHARSEEYLGENIKNSGFSFDIEIHRSGGRYICGEATALINALEGKRPNPRSQPPFPTVKGLWQLPTDVQNVETLSCIPHIINHGAEWFKSLAKVPNSSGTKLFSVSGKVKKAGCYELPMGTRLSDIIENHAGGMLEGSDFKACLPGGASTRFMPKSLFDIEMDFNTLQAVGYRLGTAAMMVFDHKTCLVAATINLLDFFKRESCGWCTPCREGLPHIQDLLIRIEKGEGEVNDYPKLLKMVDYLSYAFCAFAPGAGAPVESLLTVFKDEVMAHIEMAGCPFKG
jgi:NADH-quinone oxidoreductase subunit F